MFKINNRNTRTRCEICSKLTMKIPERCQYFIYLLLIPFMSNVFNIEFINYEVDLVILIKLASVLVVANIDVKRQLLGILRTYVSLYLFYSFSSILLLFTWSSTLWLLWYYKKWFARWFQDVVLRILKRQNSVNVKTARKCKWTGSKFGLEFITTSERLDEDSCYRKSVRNGLVDFNYFPL